MKSKKVLALLVVLSIIQLIFPVSFMAYEKIMTDAIDKKGKSYTLDYTWIGYFSADYISVNTESIYTVGYTWDRKESEEGYVPHDTVSVYGQVGIKENENGTVEFFDTEKCDKEVLTKDNWFNTYRAFQIQLEDYEFVKVDFGLTQLFELLDLLGGDNHKDLTSENFTEKQNGYYHGIFDIPVEGKITLKVYNGFAKISEFYIGDELILKLK